MFSEKKPFFPFTPLPWSWGLWGCPDLEGCGGKQPNFKAVLGLSKNPCVSDGSKYSSKVSIGLWYLPCFSGYGKHMQSYLQWNSETERPVSTSLHSSPCYMILFSSIENNRELMDTIKYSLLVSLPSLLNELRKKQTPNSGYWLQQNYHPCQNIT